MAIIGLSITAMTGLSRGCHNWANTFNKLFITISLMKANHTKTLLPKVLILVGMMLALRLPKLR